MFNPGILAIVFVFLGVLVTFVLPATLDRLSRWQFARRFEHLVEANQIVPILTRDVDNPRARSMLQRKRMTIESFLDAWIGGQLPSRAQEWKPLAAAFISRPDERPVTAAILISKAQKAEAQLWLQNFYHRRDAIRRSKVQHDAVNIQQQQTTAHSDSMAPTSGRLRFSTLILMPSKLQPRFQSTEAGAKMAEQGAGRWTIAATGSPQILTRNSEKETGIPRSSFGDPRGLQNLWAMEIGVSEQNFDQALDIPELVADNSDEGASIVSLEGEDDRNEMTPVLATPRLASRYPLLYGRSYAVTRPMYTNPLLPTRNRIY